MCLGGGYALCDSKFQRWNESETVKNSSSTGVQATEALLANSDEGFTVMLKISRVVSVVSGLLLVVAVAQPKVAHAQWVKGASIWVEGTSDNNYYTTYNSASGTKETPNDPNLKSKVTAQASPGPQAEQCTSDVSIGQQGAHRQRFVWNGSGSPSTLNFSGTATVALIMSVTGGYGNGQSYLNCGNPYFGGGVIMNLTSPDNPLTGSWTTSVNTNGDTEYFYNVNFKQNLRLHVSSSIGSASGYSTGSAAISVN